MNQGIHISFSGPTMGDVRNQAVAFLAALDGDKQGSVVADAVLNATKPETRGRKTNAEKAAMAAVQAVANGKADDASDLFGDAHADAIETKFTKEDVNKAVQSVLGKIGGPKTRELLERYGAKSTKDVKAEDYAKLVAECTKLSG